MAERIDTPFTNEHFAAWCLKMVGHSYWYGTCGYKATKGLLSRKRNQYSQYYPSSLESKFQKDIANKDVVCDCIGGCKAYAWTGGGQSILDSIGKDGAVSNSYGSNGCPDKGANSMFTYAKSKGRAWGTIDTLPDVVGLCLHKDGHVGYTVGGGYAVEWQGTRIGCVKTVIANRKWTEWFQLPFINYDGADLSAPADLDVPLGSRLLKRGLTGKDVKALQELLNQLGATLEVDGIYGSKSEAAVKAFQKKAGLKQDGLYGNLTHTALMAAVGDDDVGQQTATAEKPEDEHELQVASQRVIISSTGGKVNIRCGNGTGYSRISAVAPGTVLEYIATAQNGWQAVKIGNQVGWVSGEFSQLESAS